MKLFAAIFVAASANNSCFTCIGKDVAECKSVGKVQTCSAFEDTCEIVHRTMFDPKIGAIVDLQVNINKNGPKSTNSI